MCNLKSMAFIRIVFLKLLLYNFPNTRRISVDKINIFTSLSIGNQDYRRHTFILWMGVLPWRRYSLWTPRWFMSIYAHMPAHISRNSPLKVSLYIACTSMGINEVLSILFREFDSIVAMSLFSSSDKHGTIPVQIIIDVVLAIAREYTSFIIFNWPY